LKARYHKFTGEVPVVFVEDAKAFMEKLGAPVTEAKDRFGVELMHEVNIGPLKMLVFSEAMLRTISGSRPTPVIEAHLAIWKGQQKYPQNEIAGFKYALALAERYKRKKCHELIRRTMAEATGYHAEPMEVEIVGQRKAVSDKKVESVLFEEGILLEMGNTNRIDVNEIYLGYYMLGGTWTGFVKAADAKAQLRKRREEITPEEFKDEQGKAKVMAREALNWAQANGYGGGVKKAWWTARPGDLSKATGLDVSSAANPTDTLVQFGDGKFLGLSAKSGKKKSSKIAFKNPGMGTIDNALNAGLQAVFSREIDKFIKKHDLSPVAATRKTQIRDDRKIESEANKAGSVVHKKLRDELFKTLNKLNEKALKEHVLSYWMDANVVEPPYIKVTGKGSGGDYTASVMNPLNNEKLTAISHGNYELKKVGDNSIGFMADGKRVFKMRFKFSSQFMASSMKLSGDQW